MPPTSGRLSVTDHSRDSAGMTYVYPVVSRRAGGVSIGINLNPNNACNWRCIYCQVPDLKRGGPPSIDLAQLRDELGAMLDDIVQGDYLARHVPEGQRRLIDVAFSGNGEPTSAAEFPLAVNIAVQALAERKLLPQVRLRLITNGSQLDKRAVRRGIESIGAERGEVWFKVDAATPAGIARINGSRVAVENVARRLGLCSDLCPTWVQTCLFAFDGKLPDERELGPLVDFLGGFASRIEGVLLYGLARPSAQPDAARLSPVSEEWLAGVGERLKQKGLTVKVSP